MSGCEMIQVVGRSQARWFDVPVKTKLTALLPIRCVIYVDPRSRTECAEKNMVRWINHDSYMPAPRHQIARLRMDHALKLAGSNVKIGRIHVGIREPRPIID